MSEATPLEQFILQLNKQIDKREFVKLTLGNYKGSEKELRNIYIKKVIIRELESLSFTYRFKTKDIVKNFSTNEGIELIESHLQTGFLSANLFGLMGDIQFERKGTKPDKIKYLKPSFNELPSIQHDHSKNYALQLQGQRYLFELGLTNQQGVVYKHAQDKYRQINHYIELLRPLLDKLAHQDEIEVVDMGSGKGYLTFALADYLKSHFICPAKIKGIE